MHPIIGGIVGIGLAVLAKITATVATIAVAIRRCIIVSGRSKKKKTAKIPCMSVLSGRPHIWVSGHNAIAPQKLEL
jgi:hypothetical protein